MQPLQAKLATTDHQKESGPNAGNEASGMLKGKVDQQQRLESQGGDSGTLQLSDPYGGELKFNNMDGSAEKGNRTDYYPAPRKIQAGTDLNQSQQFARNTDGTLNFEQLAGVGDGRMMSGGQRWTNEQQGYYIDTSIRIPANTPRNEMIVGHLPSGDPIQGKVVSGKDGRPHFRGWTVPARSGHGKAHVPLDIPLL